MDLGMSNNFYVNGQVNYQIILLVITGVSLLTTYLLNKENFLTYFSLDKSQYQETSLNFLVSIKAIVGLERGFHSVL